MRHVARISDTSKSFEVYGGKRQGDRHLRAMKTRSGTTLNRISDTWWSCELDWYMPWQSPTACFYVHGDKLSRFTEAENSLTSKWLPLLKEASVPKNCLNMVTMRNNIGACCKVVTGLKLMEPWQICATEQVLSPFHATHEISRLEALALLIWLYFVLEKMCERNVSRHLSTVKANY
jgi:hypothetical protein